MKKNRYIKNTEKKLDERVKWVIHMPSEKKRKETIASARLFFCEDMVRMVKVGNF